MQIQGAPLYLFQPSSFRTPMNLLSARTELDGVHKRRDYATRTVSGREHFHGGCGGDSKTRELFGIVKKRRQSASQKSDSSLMINIGGIDRNLITKGKRKARMGD